MRYKVFEPTTLDHTRHGEKFPLYSELFFVFPTYLSSLMADRYAYQY